MPNASHACALLGQGSGGGGVRDASSLNWLCLKILNNSSLVPSHSSGKKAQCMKFTSWEVVLEKQLVVSWDRLLTLADSGRRESGKI